MKPIKIEQGKLAVSARREEHFFVDAGDENLRDVVVVNLWHFEPPEGEERYPWPIRIAEGVAILNPIDDFDARKALHLALTRALDFAQISNDGDRRLFHEHVDQDVILGRFD